MIPGSVATPGDTWSAAEARVTVERSVSTATLFVRFSAVPGKTYRKEVKLVGWQTYTMEPELVGSSDSSARTAP